MTDLDRSGTGSGVVGSGPGAVGSGVVGGVSAPGGAAASLPDDVAGFSGTGAVNSTRTVGSHLSPAQYSELVYAGVLGKIIGVYLGRPVEGWPYADIIERFGMLRNYVNGELGIPIVTADDDISGSFGFARSVNDHALATGPSAEQVGQTWLNYIVEDRTILWWGGRGRSSEHTAFLNLQDGIMPPASGSFEHNGKTLPVQVGAQIFIDGLALMCPGDPHRAAHLARTSASVSHDGIALDAAAFIAACEALAFVEQDLRVILNSAADIVAQPVLTQILEQLLLWVDSGLGWREIRDLVENTFGYSVFEGPCPVETNFAAVLMSLLCAGDDFQESISIAASAGWDTDSNAGVVGAFNAVRLGLDSINDGVDLRGPVADQLYVVTSDGGECISDAVRITREIVAGNAILNGLAPNGHAERFAFEFPGSLQGFTLCDVASANGEPENVTLRNVAAAGSRALEIEMLSSQLHVSTPTFLNPITDGDNFSTIGSPTLYSGQIVNVDLVADPDAEVTVTPFVVVQQSGQSQLALTRIYLEPLAVNGQRRVESFEIPDIGYAPILRLGFKLESMDSGACVRVFSVDWNEAPRQYSQSGILMSSIWDLTPLPLRGWVSSAKNFEADFRVAYSVSHPRGTGVVTTGTRDWTNYSHRSQLIFNPHNRGGLVVRARGHQCYYGLVFSSWSTLSVVRVLHGKEVVLASVPFPYEENEVLDASLEISGFTLRARINGTTQIEVTDSSRALTSGAAGFLVEQGTMLADGLEIASIS